MDFRKLTVPTSTSTYEIVVGRGMFGSLRDYLFAPSDSRRQPRIALITDETVGALYAAPLLETLRTPANLFTVPAGENSKSLAEAGRVAEAMIAAGLDRHSLVLALGGGVVGDLAGFVASIFMRGIPVIQIPTTIIAQVDSAVGGKTGVNVPAGKNLLGTFHPPAAVIVDVDLLATLPAREFNAGFAEIIKHAVIRDVALFDRLFDFERGDADALAAIILRNLEIKTAIVTDDEFETKGLRALLNFGHTVGHAIEGAAGYGRFLHGEAIALGMVAAARLSMEFAGLPGSDFRRVVALLRRFELPVRLPSDVSFPGIMASLARDKKFESGRVRFVVTPGVGDAAVSSHVTVAAIEEAVRALYAQP